MVRSLGLPNRQQAIEFGQEMLEVGAIRSVVDEQVFLDKNSPYCFGD